MTEIIKVKGIHKFYKNGSDSLEAMKGVSFELKQGETLAIMGSSGSGKSTLLHIVGAMVNSRIHFYPENVVGIVGILGWIVFALTSCH